jgi:hypothetical protein
MIYLILWCTHVILTHTVIAHASNSMLSNEIWKKHARLSFQRLSKLHETGERVLFEVF